MLESEIEEITKVKQELEKGTDCALFLDKRGTLRKVIITKGIVFDALRKRHIEMSTNYDVLDENNNNIVMMNTSNEIYQKRVYLDLIFTNANFRGRGMSSSLLNLLQQRMMETKARVIYGDYCPMYSWYLEHKNEESYEAQAALERQIRTFYQHNGFEIIKYSKYKANPNDYPCSVEQMFGYVKSSKDSEILYKEIDAFEKAYEVIDFQDKAKLYIDKRMISPQGKYKKEDILSIINEEMKVEKGI